MNIYVKILNKISKLNPKCIKKNYIHDQIGFIPGMQGKNLLMLSHDINRLRKKKQTSIAIDAEKAFGKIQKLFVIQKQQQNSHSVSP